MARTSRNNNSNSKKPRSSNGGLLIIVLILLVIVLILAFKDQLKPGNSSTPSPSPSRTTKPLPDASPTSSQPPKGNVVVDGQPSATPNPSPSPQATKPKPSSTPSASPSAEPQKTSASHLYFVQVTDESIKLVKIARNLALADSPLSVSIRALLQGPNGNELSQGYLSLIPSGTKLLSAYVQGKTAFLSFSEEFEFNHMGADGLKAQLKQVIYTATEFGTVEDVQILIEGKKMAFLGGDGFNISKPLSRKSF